MTGRPRFMTRNKEPKNRKLLKIVQIETFDQLEQELKQYISNKKELKEIRLAYDYAAQLHDKQLRRNGDAYIYHPLSTAFYLGQLRMGPKTIIAGLLHDILEDTPVTAEEIGEQFGSEVSSLVAAVTKVSYFAKENREEQKSEYLRKIYLSMAEDIRVIIIKLADRLHNMLTIEHLPVEKQKVIARETLDIYSAIAHRIGMKQVKGLLEDMSFKVLNLPEYQKIQTLVQKDELPRQTIINQLIKEIEVYLRSEKHMKVIDIFGRPKTSYSIYRKMNQFGRLFDDLKDLLAIRIITKSNDDCYKILGFLHQKYAPLTNRFKDYIATPKNGVYQSLHTTLADADGHIFEVQIRTEKMDQVAESGAAAHWAYKEGEIVDVKKRQKEIDQEIDIFKRIIDLDQQKITEQESIETMVQEDFFTSMIYVLTPNKKVITLPYGSTVLDFAYQIHSEIGMQTIGAKIDGTFAPINTVLKSGQIVEIKTSPKQKPTYEWLKIAATSTAKSRIRKYLSAQMVETNIRDRKDELKLITEKVKNNLNSYINQHNWKWKKQSEEDALKEVKKLGYQNLEEFLLDIDKGIYSIAQAVDLVYIDHAFSKDDIALESIKVKKTENLDFKNEVLVNGIANLKVQLAACCLPVPNENIVGFVSKGHGIKVHLENCVNVSGEENEQRLVAVHWNENVVNDHSYLTNIKYYATDRPNLLYDISKVLTSLKASIINASLNTDEKNLLATGLLKIKVKNSDQLQIIISALKAVPAVVDVKRAMETNEAKPEN